MRRLLFFVLLFSSVAYGQNPTNYVYRASRERLISGMFDSTLRVPRYSGTPSGLRTSENSQIDGAVAMDTVNHILYIWSGNAWVRLAKYSEIAGGSTLQQVTTAGNTTTNKVIFGADNSDTVHNVIFNYPNKRNVIFGPRVIDGANSYISDSSFYAAFNSVDTLTASNRGKKTVPRAGVGIYRNTYFNNGSTFMDFDEAGALHTIRKLNFDNADSVSSEASSSDYSWGVNNMVQIANANGSGNHRAVIRSGPESGGSSWDATPVNVNTMVLSSTATNSLRLRGWWAGTTSYLYGNNARDTVDNWMSFYATDFTYLGPHVKKYYGYASNFYNNGFSPAHIDSLWFLYERDAGQVGAPINSYSYINGKLSIGGNVTGPTERLQVQGNALVTDTTKIDGKLRANNLNTGIPAGAKRLLLGSDNMVYAADTLTGFTAGSGTTNNLTKWTGSSTLGNSLIVDDGTSVNMTNLSNTNGNYLLVMSAFAGNPYGVHINNVTTATGATQYWMLSSQAANSATGSVITHSLGHNNALNNMYFHNFNYVGNQTTTNYMDYIFHTGSTSLRHYASGNFNMGATTMTDEGYRLNIGGKLKVSDSVLLSGIPHGSKDDSLVTKTTSGLVGYVNAGDLTRQRDTIPLFVFGGGGAQAGDTTTFSTSTIYGSFYNDKSDTLVITKMLIGLQGTSPDVTITIYYNDSLNVTAGATKLVSAGNQATDIYTGTSVTSFDNAKIPPGVWVWCKTTTVATKPTYLTVSLSGYKSRTL